MSASRVVVIGDIMLDTNWHCKSDRISPEAPVPVLSVSEREHALGGAANVAANISTLDVEVVIIGGIGNDKAGEIVRDKFNTKKIIDRTVEVSNTTEKVRVKCDQHNICRIDRDYCLQMNEFQNLKERVSTEIRENDIVVLSDYNKGVLQHPQDVIKILQAKNCVVIVDPKKQDLAQYEGATILKPNKKEFESYINFSGLTSDYISELQALRTKAKLDTAIVTMGSRGIVYCNDEGFYEQSATARFVSDVTGAGDVVTATIAVEISKGNNIHQAIKRANELAGLAVQQNGTEFKYNTSVVLTNGVFDILHKGHISLLNEAKTLGDKLIVAINSDESTKRLKGNERPIKTQEERAFILRNLNCVDEVLIFDEDTPLELIQRIRPDVLVKGGDYSHDEVVGREIVEEYGGSVKIIEYQDDYSTSKTVNQIRGGKS